jgi:hypothetical protein
MRKYTVILNESTLVFNAAFLYFFIKKLVTPFEKTKAFKLGIIDANGNNLIPRKSFTSDEQYKAYTLFDVVVFNIKKLLGKLPLGQTKIATFAAALWLLKEEKSINKYLNESLMESKFMDFLEEIESIEDIELKIDSISGEMFEDVPANSVGAGGVVMFDPVLVSRKKKKLKDFLDVE